MNFLLAFRVHTCHKSDTARLEARRLQVEEGHSIGRFCCFGSTPENGDEIELPQRFAMGASAARGVSGLLLNPAGYETGTAGQGFPDVLTAKEEGEGR